MAGLITGPTLSAEAQTRQAAVRAEAPNGSSRHASDNRVLGFTIHVGNRRTFALFGCSSSVFPLETKKMIMDVNKTSING